MDTKAKIIALMFLVTLSYVAAEDIQCAKWTCGDLPEKQCAHSEFSNGKGSPSVVLKNICDKEKQYCGVSMQSIYSEPIKDYGCVNNPAVSEQKVVRYPGEKCEKDEQCYSQIQPDGTYIPECKEGVCANGYIAGKTTTDEATCVVGTYLKSSATPGEPGTCALQLGKEDVCTRTTECKNNLICYNERCTEYGSQKDGYFDSSKIASDTNYMFRNFICASATISIDGKKCLNDDYAAKHTEYVDSNGYVKCEYGDQCEYLSGIKIQCTCGINSAGNGYCTRPASRGKINIKNFRRISL